MFAIEAGAQQIEVIAAETQDRIGSQPRRDEVRFGDRDSGALGDQLEILVEGFFDSGVERQALNRNGRRGELLRGQCHGSCEKRSDGQVTRQRLAHPQLCRARAEDISSKLRQYRACRACRLGDVPEGGRSDSRVPPGQRSRRLSPRAAGGILDVSLDGGQPER